MFERYTDDAREVMAHARQEAQNLRYDHMGTEHILLGLIEVKTGVAADILSHRNVNLKYAKEQVLKLVSKGTASPDGEYDKLPRTPHAQSVLDDAIKEARELKHSYIGTEHILLGLLHENEGGGCEVLRSLGLQLDDIRQDVLHFLSEGKREARVQDA